MKPSWTTAPEWANYLAMDEDGRWFWFEFEPSYRHGHMTGHGWWYENNGKSQGTDWTTSLEGRP